MDEGNLKAIPLFSKLSKRERREIAQHADEVDVPEGRELVREGDLAYEFFVIERGGADVMRDGERLAHLGPGDFFGEMGLVEPGRRSASVVTTEATRVIVMTGPDFRYMSRSSPKVAEQIRAAVEQRVRAALAPA